MIAGHSVIISVFILRFSVSGFPVNPPENAKVPSPKVLDFLKKFGYIEEDDANSGALYTETGISETLKIVQRYGAIEETGVLDNATLHLMSSPRCGVRDIVKPKRGKRYVLGSEGWDKRTITYFIANWSPKLGEDSVTKNIQLALDTWGKYGHLRFQKAATPDADIIVAFGSSYHGDRYPFDGPGNILAHAFFPNEDQGFGGDIHFDADEEWKDGWKEEDEEGMDFLTVAVHELGHSLGLSHSIDLNSVMFPYYRRNEIGGLPQLGYDDILGMYELYIRRNIKDDNYIPTTDDGGFETTTTSSTSRTTHDPSTTSETSTETTTEPQYTTNFGNDNSTSILYTGDDESVDIHRYHDPKHTIPSTNSPSLPYICHGRFDAVAVLRQEIFIFKERYVWRLKDLGKVDPGYPLLITQMFPDLPTSIDQIDAAYERPDGMIVLFTGDMFWVYDGKSFVENSPKPLSYYGLPPNIDKIDAVQNWARNGKTYLYKQNIFWRYNETAQTMDEGYPMDMQRWKGVPHNLDAATTWKGITYFFKDELYWKFDNQWITITDQSPLPSPQLWLGCPEDERSLARL
ncbi:72 kDa type IV collagenase-like [Zophobas morio]|uniref:72 kDa type IV collagenase-like n=1 Tax=Zophobas morio TaxID=2755281 RepID=UPI003083309C